MKKRACFYLVLIVSFLCFFSFFCFPFEFLVYEPYQGSMYSQTGAFLFSKEPISYQMGMIENKKYSFSIIRELREKEGYLTEISFEKTQPITTFTIVFKKEKVSIWKLILKEWRKT